MPINVKSEPVTDKGTGLYPMTRPAEVTVAAPSNESTGAYPFDRPAEVTVEHVDPTQSTGAYPTSGPVAVHQWPSTPGAEAGSAEETEAPQQASAVTEAENEIVEPDAKPHKVARATRTATKKRGA